MQGGGPGDLGDLSKMMGDLDPAMLEEMAGLGAQFDEVMKMMAEMTPEELEKQMKDAMEMMQSGYVGRMVTNGCIYLLPRSLFM